MENIKKIIKKIIKENYSNKYQDLENFVIDSIDFDEEVSRDEKLKTGLERFEEEYGFIIKRYGIKKAFIEYLQGLPSWIDIPYYYYDMKNLLYSLGFDEVENMEDHVLSKFYYDKISDIFLDILKKPSF
jgi:hypothetical protein